MREHNLTLKITKLNGVELVRAGVGEQVRILDHSGLESLPVEVKTVEHAMLDGGYIAQERITSRRITLDLDFMETNLGWHDIQKLFPARETLILEVSRDGTEAKIAVRRDMEVMPLGERGILDPVACQMTFIAVNPYFQDTTESITAVGETVGGLEYLPTIQYAPTIQYESFVTVNQITVNNPGDYPVGFVYRLNLVNAVSSLSIYAGNKTMQFSSLPANAMLVVDTSAKTVTINGLNGFRCLENGEFAMIPTGSSTIHFSNFIGTSVVEFSPVYEGV